MMRTWPGTKLALTLTLLLACGGDDKKKDASNCGASCNDSERGADPGRGTNGGDGDSGGGGGGHDDAEACPCPDGSQQGDGDQPGPGDGDGGGGGDGDGDGDGDSGLGPDGGGPKVEQPTCSAAKAPDLSGLGLEPVASGLNNLVHAAQPKGSADWYLVEQGGVVKVLKAGSTTPTVFLDLSSIVSLGSQWDERGLLSIAFPPDYATSGLFYVMVTPTTGTYGAHDVVFRYKRQAADPYKADTDTRTEIVDVPASSSNHNGGTVLFGPDGLLYVGTGDGGGSCNDDRPGMPQALDSLYGKILRLDPTKAAPYAAAGNPFAAEGDARVLHYGLRNPFRFGFDSHTGDLYIGDVGQSAFEEINIAPKGATGLNFGWAAFEGNDATCKGRSLRAGSQHTPPILSIDRRGGSKSPFFDYKSVIGGVVYRGKAIEKLRGAYLFGDFEGKRLGALYRCGQQMSPVATLLRACEGTDEACFPMAAGVTSVAAIVEGAEGEVYLVVSRSKLMKLVAK